ncbi:MAG: hypothetical protein IKN97_10450 [Lachnospiraceae bacterium]|nr:hypothetical protein [Lachnospiraceae bacterium]
MYCMYCGFGFSDEIIRCPRCSTPTKSADPEEGEYDVSFLKQLNLNEMFYFGMNASMHPIIWKVIKKSRDEIFAITRDIQVKKRFHEGLGHRYREIDWNRADLCEWLNKDFFENGFSKKEQELFLPHSPEQYENDFSYYGTHNVNILSKKEYDELPAEAVDGFGPYWLCTSVEEEVYLVVPKGNGSISSTLCQGTFQYGVRPVIKLAIGNNRIPSPYPLPWKGHKE